MSQKQPVEATVEFLASQHESLPSASEETAAAEPVANSEMPQFAPPTVTGELGRLGKYRIQKELGRGGMGAVYLAFDERLQRQIALKVMLPKFAANANAKDRFLREARAAARISSDHVVNIFEADEIDGTPYIALQLLQGYPLDEYLKKKGSPSLAQIVRIGREIAIGLAAAHKLGLVHRDIKPGNVWLEAPNGRVKILDFGLAKPVEGTDSAELTAMGSLVGTPAYMAPEQGRGQTLDGRADLFSLGCVLYRLCTGKLPFARSTLMSILIAVATEEPTPVRELNPNVPEPLAELIRRLMAKNAADRPANAQAVVKELDGLIEPTQKSAEVIPHVFYAPMAVSVQESNPFADIDTVMDSETAEPHAEVAKLPPRKFPAILVGSLVFALIAIVLAGFIIIKITNKDGTVTEVKVPKDSKIEVDGKTVTTGPKKPEPLVKLDPLPPWTAPKAIPIGQSPFDKLDPNAIPKDERFDWQPKELVGVIGSHRGCDPYYDSRNSHVFSPDGRWLIRNSYPMLIWDAKTLVLRYSQYAFGKAAFSSDGKTMAIGSGNTVDLVDLSGAVPTLIQRRTVVPPGEGNGVHGAAIFNNGKSIAAGTGQGHLRIYDLDGPDDKPRMILREKNNPPSGSSENIMVTPDGKRLGAICGEPTETKPGEFAIRFWDISGAAPKDLFSIPHNRKEGWLSALLSVDGKTLFVTATNGKWVEAYDVSGSEPKQLDRVEWKEGVAGQFIGAVLDGNTIRLSVSDGMQLWQFADGKLKKIKDLPANLLRSAMI